MKTKIGIIICDRYKTCAGGKCFRAMNNRDGAFDIYSKEDDVELVGYTTCGGCPGGNIEYAPEEMKRMVPKLYILQLDSCWISTMPIFRRFKSLFQKSME